MSAIVMAFISAKGGSGKTVTSSALGTFLANLGFKVLLVDTDASTNGMTLLFLDSLLGPRRTQEATGSRSVGLFDYYPETESGIVHTPIIIGDNLRFLPATFAMTNTENMNPRIFSESLQILLNDTRDKYNFILLDAQAGSDIYARISVQSADQCIIVSEYDPVSAVGVERLKALFSDSLNPANTWTLFNKVLPEFTSDIGVGLSIARYLPPIPWDSDVVRAFARRDLAINMGMPNAYTLAISQISYILFQDEIGNTLEEWSGFVYESTTTPIRTKLDELDLAGSLMQKQIDANGRLLKLYEYVGVISMTVIISGISFFLASDNRFFNIYGINGKDIPFGELSYALYKDEKMLWAIFFGVLVAVMCSSIMVRILDVRRKSRSKTANTDAMELIKQEREKLKISLTSAESILQSSRNAGVFERKRRASPIENVFKGAKN